MEPRDEAIRHAKFFPHPTYTIMLAEKWRIEGMANIRHFEEKDRLMTNWFNLIIF